mmetsp:Transcript_3588/g.7718  ORF Transcript_3588/g.7718 Transcript_3588/m.7718 type:complete len:102 (+) Transcript_3588:196-501(+)
MSVAKKEWHQTQIIKAASEKLSIFASTCLGATVRTDQRLVLFCFATLRRDSFIHPISSSVGLLATTADATRLSPSSSSSSSPPPLPLVVIATAVFMEETFR